MAASSDRLRPRSLVCWPVCARLCVGKVFENGLVQLAAEGYDPLDSVAPDPRSIAADPQDSVALDPLVSVAATGSYKATQNQRSRLISLNLRINRTRACTYALNLFRMSLVSQQQYAQRL